MGERLEMNSQVAGPNISGVEMLVDTIQELSLASNMDSVTKIVRTVARELTGADGATFVLKDRDLCYYVDEDAISPLWKGSRFPMKTCISGWVMMNKKPAVIEDIFCDERIPVDAYKPTFVKSLVMVPIRKKDPIGAIGNYWANKRKPSKNEVALLQSLADITAVSIENINIRQELENKLRERNRMVDQLNVQKKQLEEFTNIIAHNMRAPLSNLLLLSDMIEQSDSVDDKLEYIKKQSKVINILHESFEELVNAIHVKIDFSVEREHLEFQEVAAIVMEKLKKEIENTNAAITFDFTNAATAFYPRKYLVSILYNLLSNAIKFRSEDRKPKIRVESYKKDGWTFISVRDNGLGIDLKKHGDKLFKLRKTFHHHPEAKGFGLFITKTQVEAMEGNINVESTPGKGSIFIVKLFKNK